MDITIDTELEDYLPGVPKETDDELARSLVASNGPLDKITCWLKPNGERVAVDGHRRLRLCARNGIQIGPHHVRDLEFTDKDEVKSWMDSYQSSRRNMTESQRAIVMSRVLARERVNGSNAYARVADQFRVNPRTVMRAQGYAEALSKLPADVRRKIEGGQLEITQKEVLGLSELPELHVRRILSEVEAGSAKSLSDAIWGEGEAPPHFDNAKGGPRKKPKPKPRNNDTVSSQDLTEEFKEIFQLLGKLKDKTLVIKDQGVGVASKCLDLIDRLDSHYSDWRDNV